MKRACALMKRIIERGRREREPLLLMSLINEGERGGWCGAVVRCGVGWCGVGGKNRCFLRLTHSPS